MLIDSKGGKTECDFSNCGENDNQSFEIVDI